MEFDQQHAQGAAAALNSSGGYASPILLDLVGNGRGPRIKDAALRLLSEALDCSPAAGHNRVDTPYGTDVPLCCATDTCVHDRRTQRQGVYWHTVIEPVGTHRPVVQAAARGGCRVVGPGLGAAATMQQSGVLHCDSLVARKTAVTRKPAGELRRGARPPRKRAAAPTHAVARQPSATKWSRRRPRGRTPACPHARIRYDPPMPGVPMQRPETQPWVHMPPWRGGRGHRRRGGREAGSCGEGGRGSDSGAVAVSSAGTEFRRAAASRNRPVP